LKEVVTGVVCPQNPEFGYTFGICMDNALYDLPRLEYTILERFISKDNNSQQPWRSKRIEILVIANPLDRIYDD
jgi:hypothetical protein